ncbi:antirestriction protein ArdA [Lentzea sp. DG1S-22]|uniref:antirestriction protein ArdA n=1 Tax=unclassified Lentzea TaxID=2643253 RepID=UPI00224B9A65|nr:MULTISPECIES: antirestriction protein ArdA [unclassified Lentzea]MCX2949921.1 antirestriction protein ArdA [Lentzea sp. NEAU-D7]WVH84705.1 antirestriction protein ArdA [Lentzea sp. DG1S-22]
MNEMPRVWIGCIGCYNGGFLVGEWVDADEADTYAEMDQWTSLIDSARNWPNGKAQAYHIVEAHEELWCYDSEGFGDLIKGECSPGQAAEVWQLVEDLGDDERDAFGAWLANQHLSADSDHLKQFQDSYQGRADSAEDYVRDWIEECDGVDTSQFPYSCIDWDAAAREFFMSDYDALDAPDGGVFIFSH